SQELKAAFRNHLVETRGQKGRIEQAFRILGKEVTSEKCEAMEGLIAEGDEVAELDGDPDAKDAALIAAAQRVEHYEIAGYGCARTFAQRLGRPEAVRLLQETLDEEAATDKKLTQIAEQSINRQAVGV